MKNIIVVGDYSRDDFTSVAKILKGRFEFFFLEYFDESYVINTAYTKWGKAIYWKDYKNAFELIDNVQPSLVLYYFIESFNHLALNVACKFRGIKTFHLEHGIRYYEIQRYYNQSHDSQIESPIWDKLKKLGELGKIKSRIKGRLFYHNTTKNLPGEYKEFLEDYFKIRKAKNIFETFEQVKSPLRIADQYISFSPEIYKFHKQSDHLPDNYPVSFIGCPSFDYLADCMQKAPEAKDIIFVDNAFESQDLFGWTKEIKKQFLLQLVALSQKLNKKLYIKAHPYSRAEVYADIRDSDCGSLIYCDEDFKHAILSSAIVIGFYSTLLMPLMALPYTTCFSLEMHPKAPGIKLSSFLVNTGAIEEVVGWDELELKIR
ncbi:MAG: hypothetical protein EOO46_13340, partial [Flavobacterium sp.]